MTHTVAEERAAKKTPAAGLKRVLSLWDLVLFGLAFVGPTAPYSMFGIGTVKSQGHLPLVYGIALVAMSLTAISYGRMAVAFPDAGSTYAYASKALHPHAGYFAGWVMILDYILIPLLSVIFLGLTANKLVPQIPYTVWVILAAVTITTINLRGIKVTARANTLLNAIMIGSLVWFVTMALRALLAGMGEGTLLSYRPFYNPAEFSFAQLPWQLSRSLVLMGSRPLPRTRRTLSETSGELLFWSVSSPARSSSCRVTWAKWYGPTSARFRRLRPPSWMSEGA